MTREESRPVPHDSQARHLADALPQRHAEQRTNPVFDDLPVLDCADLAVFKAFFAKVADTVVELG